VIDPKELADRYVAVWIEPDIERRRKGITQLWAEDGVHVLEPPQEVRETAATLGMADLIADWLVQLPNATRGASCRAGGTAAASKEQ
jgi:hypothetical protein